MRFTTDANLVIVREERWSYTQGSLYLFLVCSVTHGRGREEAYEPPSINRFHRRA